MTKHCCQVCVLSMMFCRSDSRLCWPCWHGKWWRNRENLSGMWFDRRSDRGPVLGLTLRQANAGNDMKNILYVWFSHFTLTETHRWWNYSLSLYFNKNKNSPVLTHFSTGNIETVSPLGPVWLDQNQIWILKSGSWNHEVVNKQNAESESGFRKTNAKSGSSFYPDVAIYQFYMYVFFKMSLCCYINFLLWNCGL